MDTDTAKELAKSIYVKEFNHRVFDESENSFNLYMNCDDNDIVLSTFCYASPVTGGNDVYAGSIVRATNRDGTIGEVSCSGTMYNVDSDVNVDGSIVCLKI